MSRKIYKHHSMRSLWNYAIDWAFLFAFVFGVIYFFIALIGLILE